MSLLMSDYSFSVCACVFLFLILSAKGHTGAQLLAS